jgi:23S rRNA (cytidine1920-2'-O)/16S rRNA (cytidine1409-2'-O)-methyltransferase
VSPKVAKPARLDAELVRRGLTPSRAEARRAIESGRVEVAGVPVTKVASLVAPETSIAISGPGRRFASRGGEKLDHALRSLDVEVAGRDWLDAGASTGGFTDRLLQGGARRVAAIDVGYGQLDWRLREDPAVEVIERTNVRHLRAEDLEWTPDGVVADLSFISLTTVLPALRLVASKEADFVLLVKPQFEAGRSAVGKGGVVKDPVVWAEAMRSVIKAGAELGIGPAGALVAEPPGPSGNREFFLHLNESGDAPESIVDDAVDQALKGADE